MSIRYTQMAGLLVGTALTMSALAQDSGQGTVISVETRYPGVYVADAEGRTLYTLSGVAAAGEGGLETFDTQTGGAGGTQTGGAGSTQTGGAGGAQTGGAGNTQTGGAGGEAGSVYNDTQAEGEVLPCTGECLETWPPLTVEGEATVGDNVLEQDMLSTTELEDGTMQVTYGGYPLYYFSGDENPGDMNGLGEQDFGGEWYMVSVEGGLLAATDNSGEGGGE